MPYASSQRLPRIPQRHATTTSTTSPTGSPPSAPTTYHSANSITDSIIDSIANHFFESPRVQLRQQRRQQRGSPPRRQRRQPLLLPQCQQHRQPVLFNTTPPTTTPPTASETLNLGRVVNVLNNVRSKSKYTQAVGMFASEIYLTGGWRTWVTRPPSVGSEAQQTSENTP